MVVIPGNDHFSFLPGPLQEILFSHICYLIWTPYPVGRPAMIKKLLIRQTLHKVKCVNHFINFLLLSYHKLSTISHGGLYNNLQAKLE